MSKVSVGIIGGGNMGEAILKSIRTKFSVSVCEQRVSRRNYLKKTYRIKAENLEQVIKKSKILVLAVKPQDIDSILKNISQNIRKNQLVISIAAGLTTSFLEKRLGYGIKVIRTMPNMPAQIGEGITAIAKGRFAKQADMLVAIRMFKCVGQTMVVKEDLIDAVTAVSGSGPAYVFLFAEAMMEAAQSLGLNKKQSKELVYQTLTGSASLLLKSNDDAKTLREKVTSKGGTTHAALNVFKSQKYLNTVKVALKAAQKRAKQLSRR